MTARGRSRYGSRVLLRPIGAHRTSGFSWIELMNFLSLAAVLTGLAMYGLGRYVRHAKTAEAIGSLADRLGALNEDVARARLPLPV